MCIISRVRLPRNEMLKITKINDEWQVDENQNLFGRSFYIVLNEYAHFGASGRVGGLVNHNVVLDGGNTPSCHVKNWDGSKTSCAGWARPRH
mgnify:CR=1 FL=1